MADAYEREHMAGQGEILHRQKVQAPRWALPLAVGLPASVLGVMAAVSAAHGAPGAEVIALAGGGVLYATVMGGLMIALAGGRIAVSEGELHIQIGPFGPRIRMEDILTCELGASGLRSYGLGAQMLLDGTTVYKMLGDNARAARITRRDGGAIVVVCPDAEKLVAAVQEAMRRRAIPGTRVEVEEEAEAGPRARRRETR